MTTTSRAGGDPLAAFADDPRVMLHVRERARRRAKAPLPRDVSSGVQAVLERGGIVDLHRFQAEAIELVRGGRSVVLAGGTGAGKSLCYQLPILELLEQPRDGRKQTALYLAPTKSLAQDQARRLRELGAAWAQPMLYDGDTPRQQRAQVRRRANLLLTNPDMLSAGILPTHDEWATFLRGLALVVVDESHVYRGVFGSHVAQVLRRLRRVLAAHGNTGCTFVLSSATIGNPVAHAERLTGLEQVTAVGDRGAPRSARDVVLWNPELDEETGERDSALGDAVRIYAELVERGVPTIVFARSRRQCELVHRFTRERLESRGLGELADRIAPYRAGYTPQERRETERALARGELVGVVATSALELGIDIGSLRASVVLTYPGTMTSLLQRWGRAARSVDVRGLCVLVGGDDALDQYFMRNPQELLERPVEDAVVSLANERIIVPHVAAAAAEVAVGSVAIDDELWPDGRWQRAVDALVAQGAVRVTPKGAVFVARGRPAGGLSLRSTGRGDVSIVDADSGVVLGSVEVGRAATTVHAGAVYLHRGDSFLVEHLDVEHLVATVRARTLPYYTLPKVDTDIEVVEVLHERRLEGSELVLRHGRVVVTDQLLGYQRMDVTTHRQLGPLVEEVLPPLAFETEAVWCATPLDPPGPADPVDAADPTGETRFLGSLHAAEHALIAMLPLVATCDRWDIGGLSINWHDAFEGGGIFIYDGHPGGVGITEAGFARFESWASATLGMLEGCPCEDGCPACVQSPKCGNLNEPLDKQGAIDVLAAALGERGGWSS
ncbi:MAG: DEAD/DEAH box helicase [Thermoleophilia bacterium]|nr:DEAD/DEAH box helicase [Thermoleophilia bacterium]